MPDLSEAEALGRGIRFTSNWDFETARGSLDLIEGVDVLGRDLAWGLSQELDTVARGDYLDADTREQVRATIKTLANQDGRIDRVVEPIGVERSSRDDAEVEISVEIVAVIDARGEFVFSA